MTAAAATMMCLCQPHCVAQAVLASRTNLPAPAAFDTGCRGVNDWVALLVWLALDTNE